MADFEALSQSFAALQVYSILFNAYDARGVLAADLANVQTRKKKEKLTAISDPDLRLVLSIKRLQRIKTSENSAINRLSVRLKPLEPMD